jgi:hypothetical protein
VFCWNCGAAQVMVSAELIEQAALAQAAPEAGAANATTSATDAVVWSGAIRCASLAGGIAAALTLLSFALPTVAVASFFWAISAPIIIVGIYNARYRHTRITVGFAARLGMLSGLAMLLAVLSLDTVHLCLLRYAFHAAAPIDGEIAYFFSQEQTLITAQTGAAAAAPVLRMFAIPEYRAGILLGLSGFLVWVYLAFTTVAGAFAGFLRARAR